MSTIDAELLCGTPIAHPADRRQRPRPCRQPAAAPGRGGRRRHVHRPHRPRRRDRRGRGRQARSARPARRRRACSQAIGRTLGDGRAWPAPRTFLHGTTVGLNALLERRGATVGLLATRGLPRRARGAPRRPRRPLRPVLAAARRRSCRAACACRSPERVRADGDGPRAARPRRRRAARRSCSRPRASTPSPSRFMNAYANPAHELEAERAAARGRLRRARSRSRTASRASTASTSAPARRSIDAFVRGRMGGYLRAARTSGSASRGFGGAPASSRAPAAAR